MTNGNIQLKFAGYQKPGKMTVIYMYEVIERL